MSDVVTIDAPVRHWACPACPATDRTQKPEVHQQHHACPGTGGLWVPLVEVHEPGAPADARHVPQLSASGALTSIGTEHGENSVYPGRVDRTVYLGPARQGA